MGEAFSSKGWMQHTGACSEKLELINWQIHQVYHNGLSSLCQGHDFSAVTQGLSGATAMCRVKLNVIFLVVGTVALSDRSNTESRAFCQLKSDCNSQSVYKRIKARYRISDRGIISELR